jgi:hypothetical protein
LIHSGRLFHTIHTLTNSGGKRDRDWKRNGRVQPRLRSTPDKENA